MKLTTCLLLIPLILLGGLRPTVAAVKVHGLFCEGAVLQQGMPVPVWGTSAPGAEISVDFAGQHVQTEADAQGNWTAVLEPLTASNQERTMMIRGGGESVDIGKVLVGEVWIGSGQSNMALTMKEADDGRTALPDATHPFIRVFKRPKGKKERESWHACSPSILEDFSAVAYFFGRNMHQNLHVPVGLIVRSVGGTTIQRWTPQQACQGNPFIAAKMQEAERRKDEFARLEVEKGKYDKHNKPDGTTATWLAEMSKLVYYRGKGYGGLYQRMIKPLQPYAIRGVIWYQGEFNNRSGQAYDYREWQATLVNSWRREWAQGDFPFLFVQMQVLGNATTPLLRESQAKTLQLCENTAMAVICDQSIGLHPPLKQVAGDRLAIAARNLIDRHSDVAGGPRFRDAAVDGSRIILTFDHVGTGLVVKGTALKGFFVAGDDRKFQEGEAELKGVNQVAVWSKSVKNPVAVRYAWMNDPRESMKIYDSAGLPASPFRTDDWPDTIGLGERRPARSKQVKRGRPGGKQSTKKK